MRFIYPSATDRAVIDRLADLPGTGGVHRPLGLMEFETTLIPIETAMCEDAARFVF